MDRMAAHAEPLAARTDSQATGAAALAQVPWYIWACLLAVTSGSVGTIWDISWHKSIGRDSFWTPAHVLIYLSGIIAGFSSGYVILAATFRRGRTGSGASVRMWGFRGPLGAFLCAWGGVAMIASAPFDNWWHNAYGLDVKVLSPPHIVLALGMLAIRFGTLLFILGELNRACDGEKSILEKLLIFAIVCLVTVTLGAFQEKTLQIFMHSARFYIVVAAVVPLWLGVTASVSRSHWACTAVAAVYMAYFLIFVWTLPLFPAEPKLGPVYQQVTRLVPPDFPVLLIVPAIVFDLIRRRAARWSAWQLAAVGGSLLVIVFACAQWPFANFLLSPASRNWIFGTQYVPYFIPPESAYVRHVFVAIESGRAEFWIKMASAVVIGILTTRLGLGVGASLRRMRR